MSDVFDQVEEELRSARYIRWARTWLPVIGGILLVALIAALSVWGWDTWQTRKADAASTAYERGVEALQADNPVTADAAFLQAAREGNSAYKALALMERAGIALADKRDAEALKLMDEAAKASHDPLIADAAALKAALIAMDTASLEDVQKRLAPLAKDKRPFSAYAREAQAMVLLQHGKTAEARDILLVLKADLNVPQDVGQRAALALDQIDSGAAANLPRILAAMAVLPPPAPPQAQPQPGQGPSAPAAPAARP